MGFGEGVTFPTIQAMMAAWIPSKWRSRALASTYAGAQAGTIVSLVTAPAIIAALSWPAVFWVSRTNAVRNRVLRSSVL